MSVVLPDRTHHLGGGRRAAVRSVATLDRLGVPATRELSRRRLWGLLHGAAAPVSRPARQLLALSFDLDYQADTDALDRLVQCLADAGATASIVSIGKLVEADPAPYERALAAGHELVNHTWSHPDNPVLNPDREWWDLDVDEMVEELVATQDVLDKLLGVRPSGFRSPHFKDVHHQLEALEQVPELTYLSTVLTTATPTGLPHRPARTPVAGDLSHRVAPRQPADATRLLQVPLSACPAHRWSPFCSYHSIRTPHRPDVGQGFHEPDATTALWRQLLDASAASGFASAYFDPKDVCRDQQTARWFTDLLVDAGERGWEVTAMGAVADAWALHAAPRPATA